MSVLTTAYAVPPAKLKQIRADNDVLAHLLEADDAWGCAKYDFAEYFEETIGILGKTGYPTTKQALDLELAHDDVAFGDYGLRIVPVAMVQKLALELKAATVAKVKARAKGLALTDYEGEPIDDVGVFIGDLKAMKLFFTKAAAAGHAVIVAAL